MDIDWTALGQVFGVSLLVTVSIVGLFTFGIVGSSRKAETQPDGTVAATGSPSLPARIGAYACYGLCAAAVAYGLYLIVA
ncbi:hypothetical protein [Streptomyces sp. NPDC051776]|uniref:hypothetical protein n=1 Tax=Streptomyces sp. NPDC051776 TaxID=3155414 RepID=UPI003413F928